ncbi:capsular exopolysaccharide synthesis family protein [Dysgonomonas alginatilytica]|uniref:non-specific protein-tyrosine kinase n=1 Tax=Dysgonomonas alginatilytica TaxID=1605892 RepID=A0A2V3PNY7_9BACT|nr:polysaccharide biosynthesis tyrosine autokinase [Dysgonomonas alginatilytica]PXV62964.1 capsular exopolysaccharide synthesis family protein [Dysgonomonas alginatilytica]
MEQNINRPADFGTDPYFDEVQAKTKFTFDFVLWFYRILKYWYLFALSLALFLGYAYIKNKSWTPLYQSGAVLMMESRGNAGVAIGSVQLGTLVQNSINQQMLLNSYDMVVRAVAKLPQMRVDYFKKSKFKVENWYGVTPVTIEAKYVAPSAYSIVFEIEPINSEKCRIFYEGSETTQPFSMEVPYDQFVQEPRFYIKITKSPRFAPNFEPFSFRFVSKEELIGRYSGRISSGLVRDGSTALGISIFGSSPAQDVDFLRALLQEFEEYNLTLKNEAADRTIAFIDKQMGIIADSLQQSEIIFKDFQDETGLYRITKSDGRVELESVMKSIGEVKAQEDLILRLTDEISNSILNKTELIDPTALGLNEPKLARSIGEYNNLVNKLSSMGSAHPMYAKSEQSLTNLRINILEELRALQDRVQNKKESLDNNTKEIEDKMATLPAQEREYIRYEKRYQVNDAYYTYLRQRRYEATIQKASNIPDNFIMEAPRQKGGPVNGDEKRKNYTFYFFIGLGLPLLFVIAKEEIFNLVISTKEDCERLSGLPVIGTIENISKKLSSSGSTTLVKNFPKSSFAESFRNMRIRIEYIAQKETGISTLITSAEPGDGKTFIAGNIASVYQLTGKKVVLIDFDLRRPSVGKLLSIESKKGVSNYLIGQVTLDEITITHPEYEFDVITAGTLPPNPSELIKTKKTKDLLDHLKSKYDYVIVDCSPIGLVSDAYILSKYVDTTLFVVRRGKTNKAFFKSVVSQMRNDGLEHAALVFNDVKGREGYYGTSRYYGDKSYYLKRNSYYHDDYFEK